ncbi:MAG TPA: threonine/serine dehydratase [Baekduia sp.]|uniref:threonine/serine dehydratase n=1 Tax=Baekduia sp. TaxID=2600305 RepID=UPI002D78CAAD|nr:threonine/serine dehydratase [Baekduia sp.]HET6505317.1 threonine/serine dehydratase [Baekduia sp.]
MSTASPTAADVRDAARRIGDAVHRTPLLRSRTLGERVGAPVALKAELLQRSGSFKLRGALNWVRALPVAERARGVVTVSAGNHAQSVALACREAGVDALVLMPRAASPAKVAAARGYGATVDLESVDATEAFERMAVVTRETGRLVLHPFDDPAVIAGQGTVGLEIVQDATAPDVVVVPVGGAGLVSGIALVLKDARPGARIIGVQPEATATLAASLAAGRPVRGPGRPTLADGLTAPTVGALGLEICAALLDDVVTVTEDELRDGLRFLYQRAKLAAEPAGAAAVAALIAGRVPIGDGEGVVAVVSGGNVSEATVAGVFGAAA